MDSPWELLYADDLVIIAETANELMTKLAAWKKAIEDKGLRVNMGKTKTLRSRHDAPEPTEKSNVECVVKVLVVTPCSALHVNTGCTKPALIGRVD